MKARLTADSLSSDSLLITCSSHEERCLGVLTGVDTWAPRRAILFHYDDVNQRREIHHAKMMSLLYSRGTSLTELQFVERNAVSSLRTNMPILRKAVTDRAVDSIVLDISVFTKRHLLMMLRWLDDSGLWDRLTIVYSEPDAYDISQFIPLSYGLRSFQQVPGFSACADLSRPVHLALFLGFEGERALAAYEHVEPASATLFMTDVGNSVWRSHSEELNAELLALVGNERLRYVDGLDPEDSIVALTSLFGSGQPSMAKLICPLGTKPQAVGVYTYARGVADPAAIVYASPLRHNHDFYSHGVGDAWLIKRAGP